MRINQKEQSYVEMLEEQLAEQTRYIDEIRSVKHDMQAHMMVLHHYIMENKHDKAKDYLAQIMSIPLFSRAMGVEVGRDVINEVLASRLRRSTQNIELETKGLFPEKSIVEEADLCVLFSNLISNSVEACEKLKDTDKRILLEIRQEKRDVEIIMSNPIEWEIDINILGRGSTKADAESHGYGVRNIQWIVEKYHGEVTYEIGNGLVLVKISLRDVV